MYVECRSQENLTKNKTLFDEKLIVVKMKCTVNYRIDDAALHVSHFSKCTFSLNQSNAKPKSFSTIKSILNVQHFNHLHILNRL